MLTIGDKFPQFNLSAAVDNSLEFPTLSNDDFNGQWMVFFTWPKDFTFVCPTEIATFGKMNNDFLEKGARVVGCSTDSEFVHRAWRESHPDLKDLPFPMLADIKRELCGDLGILDKDAGVGLRSTFIVDPSGTIRHVSVHDLNTGRNVAEVLRTLEATMSDELAPCGWNPGEAMLNPG
jgi:peroxiredoxin (alkyl hydroperoxide reductase subunit C)